MARPRITASVDPDHKILVVRYIGGLDGEEVNTNVIAQVSQLPDVWTYDSMIDMRRYDGTILAAEIGDLAARWNQICNGRDTGGLTAIVSDDPLVHARLSISQSFFPQRLLRAFREFEDGRDWIINTRANALKALAS